MSDPNQNPTLEPGVHPPSSWDSAPRGEFDFPDLQSFRQRKRSQDLGAAYCWFAGVGLPTYCLLCAAINTHNEPEWQSGRLSDYALLLLGGLPSSLFIPISVVAMVACGLALSEPEKYGAKPMVRLGVLSGIVMSLHYFITTVVALRYPLALLSVGISTLLVSFGWVIWRGFLIWFNGPRGNVDSSATVGFAFFLWAITATGEAMEPGFVIISTPAVLSAPILALFAYARVLWRTGRGRQLQFGLTHMMAAVTWFAAYFGTFRAAVQLALARYAELPTAPPGDCYVCTAAARGHARLVRSRRFVADDGGARIVNGQMQQIKAAEIVLRVSFPRVHRTCRRVYDWLGPKLARRMTNRFVADVAYLALVPCQMAARLLVRIAAGRCDSVLRRFYTG